MLLDVMVSVETLLILGVSCVVKQASDEKEVYVNWSLNPSMMFFLISCHTPVTWSLVDFFVSVD